MAHFIRFFLKKFATFPLNYFSLIIATAGNREESPLTLTGTFSPPSQVCRSSDGIGSLREVHRLPRFHPTTRTDFPPRPPTSRLFRFMSTTENPDSSFHIFSDVMEFSPLLASQQTQGVSSPIFYRGSRRASKSLTSYRLSVFFPQRADPRPQKNFFLSSGPPPPGFHAWPEFPFFRHFLPPLKFLRNARYLVGRDFPAFLKVLPLTWTLSPTRFHLKPTPLASFEHASIPSVFLSSVPSLSLPLVLFLPIGPVNTICPSS